ncbi:MAG: tetratricopeptide repeat protein [Hyphomonadaceae bacterium]|jgi:tetratricopeptide (TPR) repeat protein|nr:tetratricopeptide repeat protein [Hyphomonadaceae bacterium]
MSRARLPRRFALVLAFGVVLADASAWAQQSAQRPVTVIGRDSNVRRCGQALAGNDLSDGAMEACDRALRNGRLEREERIVTLVNRGVLHLRRRENEAALADFDQAVAEDPENGEALLNRGATLVQLGQFGPAISSLTEALGYGVTDPQKAYFNRAAAREALGDVRGAYEDYSTALEIQPGWALANAELARFARQRQAHLASMLEDDATP